MRRKPDSATILWAGIFLAIFLLNNYQRKAPPFVPWDRWTPKEPNAVKELSKEGNQERRGTRGIEESTRYNRPFLTPSKMRTQVLSTIAVGLDTVGAHWLVHTGGWPSWKAARLDERRRRWGGVNAEIAQMEEWDVVPWQWIWVEPPVFVLNEVNSDMLYQHPLWKPEQVRAVQRFRSRVRPLRTWDEVFQLASFDSLQQYCLPKYFRFNIPPGQENPLDALFQ